MSVVPHAKLSDAAFLNPTLGGRLPEDDLVSFVPMASLSAETAKIETTQDRPYSEVSKGFTPFLSGDVLVAKITPCFENGKIAQALLPRRNGFGSTEFHVVRARPDVSDARYLHHYLRLDAIRVEGQRRMTGSGGQRHVPASFLSDLRIPLPPLEEQRRIAAILDQAETLRTQRRAALAQLDSLTQSLFLDMFGDLASNPKFALGTLRRYVDSNSGKSSKAVLSSAETAIPVYGGNGVNGWATKALYDEPVLVFGRVGQQCGNVCITEGPSWVTDNAIVIRITDHSVLELIYVLHAFEASDFALRVRHLDLPFINQGMILDSPIPLPPLALQQTFTTRIQAIEALKATHRTALAQLDALFASLQQRAFAGAL